MPFPESKFWSQFPTIQDEDVFNLDSTAAFILQLNDQSPIETIEFLLTKLKSSHLNIQRIVQQPSKKSANKEVDNTVFLVTCYETLILKHSKVVYQRQQLKRQLDLEHSSDKENLISQAELSDSERQRIVQNILEGIRFEEKSTLLGMPNVKCYSGQSLVEVCLREKVILSFFPLHDPSRIKELSSYRYFSFMYYIDSVRNYFGEKVAFYFSFLNCYTTLFMVTNAITLIGYLITSLFSSWSWIPELFTLLNCISLFIFWKAWARESNSLAFRWGTLEAFELEKARATFRSKEMLRDPITDELLPCYPIRKTWIKEYALSLPVVLLCVYLAFEVMCIYFQIEDWTISLYNESPNFVMNVMTYVPSIVYTILIVFTNKGYRRLAEWLNENENHRTQSSHENHLIIKLVLFEFINNFMSLFYIAFYLKNIEMLKWNLFTMLTINQFADNMIEVILPFLQVYFKTRNKKPKIKNLLKLEDAHDDYYDFLELFIQFGFIYLFLPIFPMGPLIGLVNSYMEIYLDGMKYCFCLKRPLQKSARGINNGWLSAFHFLTIIVTISNLSLMAFTSQTCTDIANYYEVSNFAVIAIVEHILFALILVIWNIVPEMPKNVLVEQSRQRYLNLKQLENSKKND